MSGKEAGHPSPGPAPPSSPITHPDCPIPSCLWLPGLHALLKDPGPLKSWPPPALLSPHPAKPIPSPAFILLSPKITLFLSLHHFPRHENSFSGNLCSSVAQLICNVTYRFSQLYRALIQNAQLRADPSVRLIYTVRSVCVISVPTLERKGVGLEQLAPQQIQV